MNAPGWLFLIVSLSFVWGLCGWCFYKVLSFEELPEADERKPH